MLNFRGVGAPKTLTLYSLSFSHGKIHSSASDSLAERWTLNPQLKKRLHTDRTLVGDDGGLAKNAVHFYGVSNLGMYSGKREICVIIISI